MKTLPFICKPSFSRSEKVSDQVNVMRFVNITFKMLRSDFLNVFFIPYQGREVSGIFI